MRETLERRIMKNKTIFKTHDYCKALEKFRMFKDYGTASVTCDHSAKEYIVELVREAHSSTELMRQLLVDIKLNYDLTLEETDALDFADSAIKTLVDMGVLK